MNEKDRTNKNAEFNKVMSELKDERIRIRENTIRIQTIAFIIVIIIYFSRIIFLNE